MKYSNKEYLMAALPFAILIGLMLTPSVYVVWNHNTFAKQEIVDCALRGAEYGFFHGQKAALQGDIRIKQTGSNSWEWVKSPWDDGRLQQFKP